MLEFKLSIFVFAKITGLLSRRENFLHFVTQRNLPLTVLLLTSSSDGVYLLFERDKHLMLVLLPFHHSTTIGFKTELGIYQILISSRPGSIDVLSNEMCH